MNSVRFYPEIRKDGENGKATIVAQYWFNGQRLRYYTGVQVSIQGYRTKYWASPKERDRRPIKPNEPQAAALNLRLDQISQKIIKLHTDATALELPVTIQYFREELDKVFKGSTDKVEKEKTVAEAWEEYLEFMQYERAINTYKKHKTTRSHFQDMAGKKYKSLSFSEVNSKLGEKFRLLLVERGYQLNTVAKYIHCFRDFLNWCKDERREYFTGKIKFDVREEDIQVIFLSQEEVNIVEQAEMPNKTLEKVRDMYLFGCYTGMRYGDIHNLSKADFKKDSVVFHIGKGNKPVLHSVPLLPSAMRIIRKYLDGKNEKLLPVFTNQKMNQYVKEVMKVAGLNEPITVLKKMGNGRVEKEIKQKWEIITFHTSRKSFITIAVNNGMPELYIKSITGHSPDSRAFKKYFKVDEKTKAAELLKAFSNPSANLKAV